MLKKWISVITPITTSWYVFFIFKWLKEVREKVHYFLNTSITATCMSVEASHALQVCQWLAVGWWFSPGTPISSTNKIDAVKKNEILLKMAIKKTKNKRKFSPTLGCVMGLIFTSLFNDIFHAFSPVVSWPLQCSVVRLYSRVLYS